MKITPKTRAKADWLVTLPSCSMDLYRKKLKQGAETVFLLDETSTFLSPAWRLLVRDREGNIFRVCTPKEPLARKLDSVRKLYQLARTTGMTTVLFPVEQRR